MDWALWVITWHHTFKHKHIWHQIVSNCVSIRYNIKLITKIMVSVRLIFPVRLVINQHGEKEIALENFAKQIANRYRTMISLHKVSLRQKFNTWIDEPAERDKKSTELVRTPYAHIRGRDEFLFTLYIK